jgi:hypothetical protein
MKGRSFWGVMLTGVLLGTAGVTAAPGLARAETGDEVAREHDGPAVAAPAAGEPAPAQPVVVVPVVLVPLPEGPALAEAITTRLNNNRLVAGANIIVEVTGRQVLLVGEVPSPLARRQVVDLARTTPGVASVDAKLRIAISSPGAPTAQ